MDVSHTAKMLYLRAGVTPGQPSAGVPVRPPRQTMRKADLLVILGHPNPFFCPTSVVKLALLVSQWSQEYHTDMYVFLMVVTEQSTGQCLCDSVQLAVPE